MAGLDERGYDENDDDALVRRLSARLSMGAASLPSTPLTPVCRSLRREEARGEAESLVEQLRAQLQSERAAMEGRLAEAAREMEAAVFELESSREECARLEAELCAANDRCAAQRADSRRELEEERALRARAEATAASLEQAERAAGSPLSTAPAASARPERVGALRRLLGSSVLEQGRQSQRWAQVSAAAALAKEGAPPSSGQRGPRRASSEPLSQHGDEPSDAAAAQAAAGRARDEPWRDADGAESSLSSADTDCSGSDNGNGADDSDEDDMAVETIG